MITASSATGTGTPKDMLHYIRIPLLFLFIGSVLGVVLRWQFIHPTPGVNYTFFLHGHSHIMFLGWIFNVLYIAFCHYYIPKSAYSFFKILFITLQVVVTGMMTSFPLQGYGFYSILFSTLHTFCVFVFIIRFFQVTKHITSLSCWFARFALVFFFISAAGPFSLAYLMASGMEHTNGYYFSIYFYLHFQYNGFFLFGILSLFFSLLEQHRIFITYSQAKAFGWMLAVACVPGYFLSILWAKPGLAFNIIGGTAACIQFVALYIFISLLRYHYTAIRKTFSKSSVYVLSLILFAFTMKLVLQASTAFPAVAELAYQLRPVVIAYLHLVMVGIISLFLLLWCSELDLFNNTIAKKAMLLFLLSFTGMEICLAISPWWSMLFTKNSLTSSWCLFIFSALLSMSCFLFLISVKRNLTKISN